MAMLTNQIREREQEVSKKIAKERLILMSELSNQIIKGEFIIPVGGEPKIEDSLTLSVIFSTFRPKDIGVIDYHGAQRNYGRENIQGINLNLDAGQHQQIHSQSALYNYANKYNNVKSEMAASYIKELLSKEAGVPMSEQSTLTNTLNDLFTTFFPDKKFLGAQPTPDGKLSFSVKTTAGNLHDIDELSSGEKEILYGYLRIRNSAPLHSIILLDEPELHLNPKLVRGLPQFYKKNLVDALDNQVWLVSHSDALLREVIASENYSVFHMLPCGSASQGESQLKPLSARADLDIVLVDLVGDLASYHPGGKVVIFEGGGDSDFDQKMVATLFPELQQKANLVSGSNKTRVDALHEILERAAKTNQLPFKYYSITDKDSQESKKISPNKFSWDVYHIENYLLKPKYIVNAIETLTLDLNETENSVLDKLRECARETLPTLVTHHLKQFANNELVHAINLGINRSDVDLAASMSEAIERSVIRVNEIKESKLTKNNLTDKQNEITQQYNEYLANNDWLKEFMGRDILKLFANKHLKNNIRYEVFRNTILNKMKDDGYKPEGMNQIISKILSH